MLGLLGIKFLRGGIIFFVFIYGEVGNYLDFLDLVEWLLDRYMICILVMLDSFY